MTGGAAEFRQARLYTSARIALPHLPTHAGLGLLERMLRLGEDRVGVAPLNGFQEPQCALAHGA